MAFSRPWCLALSGDQSLWRSTASVASRPDRNRDTARSHFSSVWLVQLSLPQYCSTQDIQDSFWCSGAQCVSRSRARPFRCSAAPALCSACLVSVCFGARLPRLSVLAEGAWPLDLGASFGARPLRRSVVRVVGRSVVRVVGRSVAQSSTTSVHSCFGPRPLQRSTAPILRCSGPPPL